MEKVDEFIQVNTKTSSNNIIIKGRECNFVEYKPWLTPDQARQVAKMAREETIKEVCEWLRQNVYGYIIVNSEVEGWNQMEKCAEDLKKAIEDKA